MFETCPVGHTVTFSGRPVIPSKIVCVGRNYVEHIKELGNAIPRQMVLFCKPNSAISDTLHYFTSATRFEGELCLLMGDNRIAGIGFGFDLTHADLQNDLKNGGLPWERAKAFDGSAVFSPFIEAPAHLDNLGFRLRQNGKTVQEGHFALMIHKPDTIVEEIQTFMTLKPGDIVMTGTPKGVSTYRPQDRFDVELFDGKSRLLHCEWQVQA